LLSQGLEAIGAFFSKKVDPSSQMAISPTTKVLI